MISSITGLTTNFSCKTYSRENTTEPSALYITEGKKELTPYLTPYPEKKIQERKAFWCSLIPFKGTSNAFKENKIKERCKVNAEHICEATAVITLNNKHAGALMGGYDNFSDRQKKSDHVMFFGGIPGTRQPLTELSKKTLKLSFATGLAYGSSLALSVFIPVNLAGIAAWGISIKVLERLGFENPLLSLFELQSIVGESADTLKESTYKPIPLIGLDTSAMRKKASEIKEKAEYNTITKNCSWAVLECIKAGLPNDVIEALPSTGLYVTPTDVENVVSFLVDGGHVLLGEMDKDGVAWFDAQL